MTRFSVDPTHPSLPGHFPGRPVVPGVVLLSHVFAAVARACPAMPDIVGIESVKFLAPVLPAEEVSVAYHAQTDRIEFAAMRAGQVVLRGRARLAEER